MYARLALAAPILLALPLAGMAAEPAAEADRPPADPAAEAEPRVSFLSPQPGHVAFGPTRVEVGVLPSALAVERVEFFLDGRPVAEDAAPPYEFEWDAGYDFLSHRLRAVARFGSRRPAAAEIETARVALRERVKVEAEPDDWVEITFVAKDASGRPLRGLGKEDFRLRVDDRDTPLSAFAEERRRGRRQARPEAAAGAEGGERPLSVALLLDVSRSMRELERERFLLAAQRLLDRIRPGDEMMIITFSNDYQVRSDFTSDPRALRAALESVPRPDLGTNLYDTLDEALERLSERIGRRVVILYSDGQATVGRSSLTATPASLDVLAQTRREPVLLYWIVPHFQDITIVHRTPALKNLALGSGGRFILEREGIENALDEVGEELASQYYAAFYVSKSRHRRPHYQIRLEARDSRLSVQAPQLVSGSGSLVRRLEKMLHSDEADERLAAAVQMPRYGYTAAYFPLLRGYRRERERGVRDALLAALLVLLREEWSALPAAASGSEGDGPSRRHLERQIRRLGDARALALLETLR